MKDEGKSRGWGVRTDGPDLEDERDISGPGVEVGEGGGGVFGTEGISNKKEK